MVNRAKYGRSMRASPVTAWTQIARASDLESAGRTASLQQLIAAYDVPLQDLFEAVVDGDAEKASDWKQDFVVSHMLTGRIFKNAKPKGRFRTYLAVSVRNYVVNRREGGAARKRRTSDGARPFSQIGEDDDDTHPEMDQVLPDDLNVNRYEQILTRARAWDAYGAARRDLKKWCSEQDNADTLSAIADGISEGLAAHDKRDASTRVVLEQFKELLRQRIREEIFLAPGQNEALILGREISILLDALDRGR